MLGFDIDIYEDNSGRLFLHPMTSDWVYETLPDFNLEEDCKMLCEDEAEARIHWSGQLTHGYAEMLPLLRHPETKVIAVWHNDAPITLHKRPGRAGQRYLSLNVA